MENTINKASDEIYTLLGEGYGFNGPKELAIHIISEKLIEVAKGYADKAFVAGRSKQTWESFYLNNFL